MFHSIQFIEYYLLLLFYQSSDLWFACLDGDVSKVEEFIQNGADISFRGEVCISLYIDFYTYNYIDIKPHE